MEVVVKNRAEKKEKHDKLVVHLLEEKRKVKKQEENADNYYLINYYMDKKTLFLKAAAIGVVLNVVLSYALSPFATDEEIKPPNGATNLSFKSQIMHMLVHHKQVMLSSSLIVALLVGISCWIACRI